MNGATLRLLETIRAASAAATPPQTSLEAFCCLLHGSTTPALTSAERVFIEVVARDAEAEAWARAEAFRRVYADEVSVEKVGDRSAAAGALAIEGLMSLPRAERAALALSCVLGFTDGEVAHVLGSDADGARDVVESGVARVRAAARAPEGDEAAGGGRAA